MEISKLGFLRSGLEVELRSVLTLWDVVVDGDFGLLCELYGTVTSISGSFFVATDVVVVLTTVLGLYLDGFRWGMILMGLYSLM